MGLNATKSSVVYACVAMDWINFPRAPAPDSTPFERRVAIGLRITVRNYWRTMAVQHGIVRGWTPHGWPLIKMDGEPSWFSPMCPQQLDPTLELLAQVRKITGGRRGQRWLDVEV